MFCPATWTGLAIDLDGSHKQRFRPDGLCAAYLGELLARLRRLIEGQRHFALRLRDLCVLTVELSGAHADVWTWHFIYHASAPARC